MEYIILPAIIIGLGLILYGQFKYNKGIFLRSRYKNIRQKYIVAIWCFLLSKIHNSIHNHRLIQIPCAIF
ncbi:MAG: hypothetical protein EGR23_04760 [Holdemanella biformis]|nr:hypothetical protein [Holdemanella biformis]